ncbi:MAG: hypothetical protein ACR2QM_18440 [Longimicrobiales bacterium]
MRNVIRVPFAVLLLGFLGGCGGDGAGLEEVTISQETFVSTYVALRAASLREPNQLPTDEDRARILSDHGVTQEDLLFFAEVHGGDVGYIQGVWNEIEERLEALREEEPDSSESNT